MVEPDLNTSFDPSRCPNCGATMRLARVEPRPVGRAHEFERHVYRCEDCENISRFVFDRMSTADRVSA